MRAAPTGTRRRERRRAHRYALGLVVLAPFVAETVASANTPFLLFPIVLPLLAVIYGLPALLVRELWVRGRLTASRVVLLGIAYTAFNEGVVAATWFKLSPTTGKVLGFSAEHAGRVDGVNWSLVAGLIAFHTVYSLVVPILLVHAVVATRNPYALGRPWLGRFGIGVCLALIAVVMLGSFTPKATHRVCNGSAAHASCAAGRGLSAVVVILVVVLVVTIPTLPTRARRAGLLVTATEWFGARPLPLITVGTAFGVVFFVAFFALPLFGLPWPAVATDGVLIIAAGLGVRRCMPLWAVPARSSAWICLGLLLPGMIVGLRFTVVGQPVAAAGAVGLIVIALRRAAVIGDALPLEREAAPRDRAGET